MPEQDEADIRSPSGEPSPENESSLAAPPDPIGQPVQVESGDPESSPSPTVAQPTEVESDPRAAGENQSVELPAVAQVVSLPGEAQPGQVELQAEPEPRRLSRSEQETVDRQRRRFAACGRCGYFIADCRNQLGLEAVQTALLDAADGWVHLTTDHSFHRRVMEAYGVQLDAGFDSFDGTCPECRRRFVIETTDDGPTYLKLRV